MAAPAARSAKAARQNAPDLTALAGRTVVIKLGGSDELDRTAIVGDLATLHRTGVRVVVVHGGGKALSEWLKRAGIESRFVQGLRVTDAATLELAVMVFAGKVNKEIVARLNAAQVPAVGISGVDGALLVAERETNPPGLGLVGKIANVRRGLLDTLLAAAYVPVIAPLALGADGQIYNVNADTAAGQIAATLCAARLVFVTDVPGVLDADGKTIPTMTPVIARKLRENGAISGGMIPKVEAALAPLGSVDEVHIVDGSKAHAIIDQLTTGGGAGTRFALE